MENTTCSISNAWQSIAVYVATCAGQTLLTFQPSWLVKDSECKAGKSDIGLEQGWAKFSHEGPDLEELLKSRAAR